jgi:hypothetical protein
MHLSDVFASGIKVLKSRYPKPTLNSKFLLPLSKYESKPKLPEGVYQDTKATNY